MDKIIFNKLYLLAAIWELLLCVGVLNLFEKHKIRYNLYRLKKNQQQKYPQHVFSINHKKNKIITEQQQDFMTGNMMGIQALSN